MTRARICAATVAVSLAAVALPAWSAPLVTLSGTISNGTEGAAMPSKLVVTVVQLSDEDTEAARKQVDTGADGKFAVTDLDLAAGGRFVIGTDYLGVTYTAFVEAAEGASEVIAELTVFETTESDDAIRVRSDLITIVRGEEDSMEIIQLLTLVNSSDRTFVGRERSEGRQVLRFPLAPGAEGLVALEGFDEERTVAIGDGFATAEPRPPGEASVSYGYRVKVGRGGWPLRRAFFYPTDRVDLLVESDVPFNAPDLKFEEQVTLEGKTYRRFRGGSFRAGAELQATVGSRGPGSTLWWVLAGGLGALVLLTLGALMLRQRRGSPTAMSATRERLVQQIAELDEDFAAGILPEKEYQARRVGMKARLEKLTDRHATAGR